MTARLRNRHAFKASLLLFVFVGLGPVRGWEPAQIDVAQQMFAPDSDSADHLEPSDSLVDKRHYLVRYGCYKAMAYQNDFFTITHDESNGNYVLKKWSEWAKTDTAPPPTQKLGSTQEMTVPKDIAISLYEMWVNALYEVRYDRTGNGTLDGWTDEYTAFVRGKGWMGGDAGTPTKELPPKWLEGAANAVLQLVDDHDVERCRKKLTGFHDKLFVYWKARGVAPSTELRMHP